MSDERQRPYAERVDVLNGVYFYTPWEPDFVAKLKKTVPADYRQWESDKKRWYVSNDYADDVLALAREHWPNVPLHESTRDWSKQFRFNFTINGQRFYTNFRPNFPHEGSSYAAGGQTLAPAAPKSDYDILGVAPSAPPEVIRAAYKAMMGLYHPDRGGDTAKAQAINAAFDRLKKAGKA